MIERLTQSRKERHQLTLEDFNNWVDNQNNYVEEHYIEIKESIDRFFETSDIEI